MGIGRTFEEAFQKALRMVDPKNNGFEDAAFENVDHVLSNPTDQRVWALANAFFRLNYSVDKIFELSKIDKWFLYKLENIVQTQVTFLLLFFGSLRLISQHPSERAPESETGFYLQRPPASE